MNKYETIMQLPELSAFFKLIDFALFNWAKYMHSTIGNISICRKPDHVHLLVPDHVHLLVHRLELASHPVRKTLCWSRHLQRERRWFGEVALSLEAAVGGERVGDLGLSWKCGRQGEEEEDKSGVWECVIGGCQPQKARTGDRIGVFARQGTPGDGG